MRFDVLTLFPELLTPHFKHGITRRAFDSGQVDVRLWPLRDFAEDSYRRVDDRPFGGGPGMVMLAEPLLRALSAARADRGGPPPEIIHFSPTGQRMDQALVQRLAAGPGAVLLCGRYEGIDQRLLEHEVDEEISLGDFVLSGGELPAMVLLDAIVRQLPGALNTAGSALEDSFVDGLLDCPHYTRPEVYEGERVPEVLLSGNHAAIRRWRLKQALGNTWLRRPDLLAARQLSKTELNLLEEFRQEQAGAADGDAVHGART